IKEELNNAYRKYIVPSEDRKYEFEKSFLIHFFKIFIFVNDISFPKDFLRQFIFETEYVLNDNKLLKKLESLKKALVTILDLVDWKDEEMDVIDSDFARHNEREMGVFNLYRNIEIEIHTAENKKKLKNLVSITKKLLKNQL